MEEYSDFNSDSSLGLYDALGVTPRASYIEIKRAFHKKAKVMSPDRHLNHPNWKAVNEKFAYLVFAHHVLKNQTKRSAYDSNGFEGLKKAGVVIPAGFANFQDPLPDQTTNHHDDDDTIKLDRVKTRLAREMKLLEDYWAKRMAERLRLQEETREAFRIATYKQIVQIAWKKEILNERKNFLSKHAHGLRL